MKEFTLKKDSWHYKAAQFGGPRVCSETDICEYVGAVIRGGMLFLLCATLGLWLGGSILYSLGNLFGFLFFDYELTMYSTAVLKVTGVILGSVAAVLVGIAAKVKFQEWQDEQPAEGKEPGFLKLAYTKFKDKTCFKIHLK